MTEPLVGILVKIVYFFLDGQRDLGHGLIAGMVGNGISHLILSRRFGVD